MPPTPIPLTFDGESKSWIALSESEDPNARAHLYVIERAASGRATCRRCGEKVDKGCLRVGAPSHDGGVAPRSLLMPSLRACTVRLASGTPSAVSSLRSTAQPRHSVTALSPSASPSPGSATADPPAACVAGGGAAQKP